MTIGPQLEETDAVFWTEAFKNLPPLRRVDNVTVIYTYPMSKAFNTEFWLYLDRTLSRKDLFPKLRTLRVLTSCRSLPLNRGMRECVRWSLRAIRMGGISVGVSHSRSDEIEELTLSTQRRLALDNTPDILEITVYLNRENR